MNSDNNFYITTPIYYVNDAPHIGHAYTSIASDVLARFMRLDGKNVKFLTGTDEHGQKIAKSAEAKGKNPQEFCDEISLKFRELGQLLDLTNDDFIRTTEQRHKKAAIAVWERLKERGHIYQSKYKGWYSVRDEAFYAESEITDDKKAPTGAPVEWVEEESYFFDLSKWQDKLLEFYEANADFIFPRSRRNEVISFVKSGLIDLSISRTSFKWGIEVPGDERHVMYVWLDALTNYISAIGFPDEKSEDYINFWPANIHMVGKDIIRFHAVYWPAFLMATGLPLPKKIVAHGWWTKEGEKISKSVGNVIVPSQLVEEFGLDYVRYFLLREVIFGSDGDYSRINLINRVNSELANKIGNLLQRSLSMISKNCEGKIPKVSSDIYHHNVLLQKAEKILVQVKIALSLPEFSSALGLIVELAEEANLYIDNQAPWALRKTDFSKMEEVLYVLAETSRYIAILLQAFVPSSAAKMLDQLGVKESHRSFAYLNKDSRLLSGTEIPEPKGIFPRFEEK